MITPINLTKGSSTTDATSFNTASVSPGSNRLILLSVDFTPTTGAASPTITGNGLTWVLVDSGEYSSPGGGRLIGVWRAMGASPSSGAITIDFGAIACQSLDWSVDEFDGVDTSGTNGSGAIVQELISLNTGNGTSISLTLAAFGSANNMAFGAISHGAFEPTTVGSGFTELGAASIETPVLSLLTEYRLNVTTVDASWTTSSLRGEVAIEIKADAGVVLSPSDNPPIGVLGRGAGW